MAEYYFLHDASAFATEVRPVLAETWRTRRFTSCAGLCERLLPAARKYAEKYRTGTEEPLLANIAALPFDRTLWRALVSEVLLYGATEIPELSIATDAWVWLLAPDRRGQPPMERLLSSPIEQALRGSRDLTFGPAVYRPDQAGYNPAAEIARLADYLGSVDVDSWSAASLEGLPGTPTAEDREEELDLARAWFVPFAAMYARARDAGQVIGHESIY